MLKRIGSLAFLLILSVVFIACGGGGGGGGTSTAQGVFIDSPVEGVEYISGSQSGITNADGKFTYEVGKNVEFKIGDISLGSVVGKSQITPLDLAGTDDINNLHALNISRFLNH